MFDEFWYDQSDSNFYVDLCVMKSCPGNNTESYYAVLQLELKKDGMKVSVVVEIWLLIFTAITERRRREKNLMNLLLNSDFPSWRVRSPVLKVCQCNFHLMG